MKKKSIKKLEAYKKDKKAKPGDMINKLNAMKAKKKTAFMGMI